MHPRTPCLPLVLALLLSLAAPVGAADPRRDIARCAALSAGPERLDCYDQIARTLNPTPAKPVKPGGGGKGVGKGVGKWEATVEISPIDDSKRVILSLQANEPIARRLGLARPRLIARCSEGVTSLFVDWGVYLGIDETPVLHRLDAEPAVTSTWNISTDHEATFYGGSEAGFLQTLTGHQKLLLKVTPYGDTPVMATFNLAGLPEAVKPLLQACPAG